MTPVADLKRAHRAIWAAGNYAAVARHVDEAPPRDLLARMQIAPGHEVLDVAVGTPNLAIKAAAAGGHVIGVDLTPELFDTAPLPFDDESFDRVLSAFGVQFAPRHELAAAELVRVCRPGGLVGIVSWTPEGQVGELFAILRRYQPPPPDFAAPPPLWGSEEHVRDLLGDALRLSFRRGLNPWRFRSPEAYVAFMETSYGPMVTARERLTGEGRWEPCRREILAMVERRNARTDGSLLMYAEYLVTVGHKPE